MSLVRPNSGEIEFATDALPGEKHEWWRGAVIYQVYPLSFRDSNGDGIGDLQGVIEGLDHVASLGVDGVWLSPFFRSPLRDFGYDIADYCDVDPVFGTLDDFDRLIEKAHRLGLKLIIDQVYSHSSDLHGWFAESRQSRTNPRADWYVWADPRDDGSPPNNWQSVFGGPAWTWDSRRQQYYLHNFLPSQPDLNLHHPDVQNSILDVGRFWLERGVDGFRLDAINFLMHDPSLRDNPPAPHDHRKFGKPFDYQCHVHNKSHPNIIPFLEQLRQLTDEYQDIFTLAEIGGTDPLHEMRAFTANDRRLNSAYGFEFLHAEQLTASGIRKVLSGWSGKDEEGWPSWAFSNHDAPRAASRWGEHTGTSHAARLYVLLMMSLRGNICLYQGEELGLPQAQVAFEDLRDPEAIANWPLTLGRDGARTPMPWTATACNSGFSTGKAWLPVDPRHDALSIDRQEADQDSMLHAVRSFVRLRKNSAALRLGALSFVEAADGLLTFFRTTKGEEVLCVFNLEDREHRWRPSCEHAFERLASVGIGQQDTTLPEALPPLSGYIARRVP